MKARGWLWGLTAAAVIGGGLLWWYLRRVEADATYSGAVAALAAGRWQDAEELGRGLTRWSRYATQGWLIAGEAAARQIGSAPGMASRVKINRTTGGRMACMRVIFSSMILKPAPLTKF